jgi:hypothetical protein
MAVMDEADLLKKLDKWTNPTESSKEEDLPVDEEDNNGNEGAFDAMWLLL